MREILFRGKRIDNGKWVEGYLYITHTGTCEIGCYNAETNIERWTSDVDPATVGQYTGLKDKNGKRIFEGDILSLRTGIRHVVMFEDGAFSLENTAIPMRFANKFEVIGNIHDNQDMLKGGDA